MVFKTFDVASMVLEEANQRFAPIWEPDKEKLDILKQYCEAIDTLIEEFDGESLDIEVDETQMTICVQLECEDITIETQRHRYYDLIQRSVSFGFSSTENDTVVLKLVFPSIWNKVA